MRKSNFVNDFLMIRSHFGGTVLLGHVDCYNLEAIAVVGFI